MSASSLTTDSVVKRESTPTRLSIERSTKDTTNSSELLFGTTTTPGFGSRAVGPCAECGHRINNITDACHAMGYLYHNSCFVCCYCQRTLSGKTFYKDQDKIYCEVDYLYCGFQQAAEKCSQCGHLIAETILQAMGKSYHPGCFQCCVCTKCLDGVPFAVDSQNLIYCVTDYHLVHAPRCAGCGQIILNKEGSNEIVRIVALDREFHPECYRCTDCRRQLGDEPENRCYPMQELDSVNDPSLLCLNCHLSRIGAIPSTTIGSTGLGLKPTSGLDSSAGMPYYAALSRLTPGSLNK